MKKSERVVFSIVAAVVVLAGIVSMVVSLRSRALANREPFTLEELDQLAEHVKRTTPNRPFQPVHTEGTVDSESDNRAEVPVPKRLGRVPSREELETRWLEGKTSERRVTAIRSAAQGFASSVCWAVAAKEEAANLSCKVGRDLMALGEWEKARRYFYAALDGPGHYWHQRFACFCLAWMETDPERATRLIELSCQGEDVSPWNLVNAIELADATGSDSLAEHYRDRLHAEFPEMANKFDEESETDN